MGCTVLVGLLSGDALEQQVSQSGYSAAADGVVHHEALKAAALIRHLADTIKSWTGVR